MNEEQGNREANEAAAAEPQELPPSQKRVRTSNPDLQIVCKGGDQNEEERIFECHSLVMATYSGYFDALLSSEMKEAAEKKVIFDDVSPNVFEKAMRLVENPLAASKATPEDLSEVASFYHRCQFSSGIELAVSVFGTLLDHWTKTTTKAPLRQEKDLIIQTILFAEESSNEELIQKSIKFLSVKFGQKDACGMGIFEVEDIKKLHHFLAREGRECVATFYNEWAGFDSQEIDELLQHSKFSTILSCSFLDLLSDALIRKMKLNRIKVTFRGISMKSTSGDKVASPFVEESTTISKESGEFQLFRCWQFDRRLVSLGRVDQQVDTFSPTLGSSSAAHREQVRDLHIGDWLLCYWFEGNEYDFIFPMSRNQPLPPLGGGWVQVYDSPINEEGRLQNPTVELEYMFGDV